MVSRAFDDALAEAGGSVPVWLVLISLKSQRLRNQRELAAAVGIREATLTHHLNSMDEQGLITRRRDPSNRRVHLVELTDAGEAAFDRLRARRQPLISVCVPASATKTLICSQACWAGWKPTPAAAPACRAHRRRAARADRHRQRAGPRTWCSYRVVG
jgi:DNA-binding MarR family transcriptional regulator